MRGNFAKASSYTNRELFKQLARLESINDQLETEIADIDSLLREEGFPEGLKTLRSALGELKTEESEEA